MKPGSSGSAVLDQDGNLLGMIILSGVLKLRSGEVTASVALPVRMIARALVKLDPTLGADIFPEIPEEDLPLAQTSSIVYQEQGLPDSAAIPELKATPSAEINAVEKLRAKSDEMSRRMVKFVAKQCLTQGGEKPICHELSVIDGKQTFREMEKSGLGKATDVFPVQRHGVWAQSDWTDTLAEIAENSWLFQGSVGDKYLFTFKSSASDDRCYYEEYSRGVPLFGGGHAGWKGSVVCFEQVITDKDFNVMSVFTEMRPPDDCSTELAQIATDYGWIKLEGMAAPVLLPVAERVTAKVQGQSKLWYANVAWTDYREFRTEHKIGF